MAKKQGQVSVIPNEDVISEEDRQRLLHNARMKRYRDKKAGKLVTTATKNEIRSLTGKELIKTAKDTRDMALQVLRKKLALMANDDEALDKVNLVQLATTFGIMVDKNQLLNGLATENVAIQAKVDITMKADEAMAELNKMRQTYQEQNNDK